MKYRLHGPFIVRVLFYEKYIICNSVSDKTIISEALVVAEDGGQICVNCTLVVNSGASGCVVILKSLDKMQQLLSHTIPQDESGTFAQRCFPVFLYGNFSLAIFATGNNGPLGTEPAHVTFIIISEATTSCKLMHVIRS